MRELDGSVRAILPDLPLGGHRYPMQLDADLSFRGIGRMLVAVLDQLDVAQVVVVANDSGGVAAQVLLVEHPTRVRAALLASVDCFENFPPLFFFWFAAALRAPGGVRGLARVLESPVARRLPMALGLLMRPISQSRAEQLMGSLWTSAGVRADLKRVGQVTHRRTTLALAERFGGCAIPVHVAWTERDVVFPARFGRRLAAAFPYGRLVEPITDARSLSPLDQPAQVAGRVRDLVAAVAPVEP